MMDDNLREEVEELKIRMERIELFLDIGEDDIDPLEAQHQEFVGAVRARREGNA